MQTPVRAPEPAPPDAPTNSASPPTGLARDLGLLGLVATGVCSMVGVAINIIPFMLQRSVPGIGPYVLPAYVLASVPAVLAALAYAVLASAMPRAGGSYVYASRALSPYLGFVASFSQWFGLSIAIGVVSYAIPPFLRDVAVPLGWTGLARSLDTGTVRLGVALTCCWAAVLVNVRGVALVARTLVPLMLLTFAGGAVVIVAGFSHTQAEFAAALLAREGRVVPVVAAAFRWPPLFVASALLFASYIGFDSIVQAGGEARDARRNVPLATGIAVGAVGAFYLLFTAAVYHAVPWAFVAVEAQQHDLTAPGLLGYLLSPGWTVVIVAFAALALIKDLPGMVLGVSRLMFAWAADGIMPRSLSRVHPRWRTPHVAVITSGFMATLGILGCHLAGDFFVGVDILVTSMLVSFVLMSLAVLTFPWRNPGLAGAVTIFKSRILQVPIALAGVLALGGLLAVTVWRDVEAPVRAWYYRSTPVWIAVTLVASLIYWRERSALRRAGVNLAERFAALPPE